MARVVQLFAGETGGGSMVLVLRDTRDPEQVATAVRQALKR
jgi:hypothetical protein